MTDTQTVQIAEAKGRPMLHWVGKRPLDHVTAYPAQLVERFDPLNEQQTSEVSENLGGLGGSNLLFHGDNKDVLAWLLAHGYRGKVNLVYIDPPFDSGADYVRTIQLRGFSDVGRLEGESHSLGEQIQYTDIWANDMYLQFVYERLLLLSELLTDNGMIIVHCDWNVVHLLRCILDEIFLPQNLVNEVIWYHAVIGAGRGIYRRLPKCHETLLWYAKGENYTFNTDVEQVRVPYKDRITKNLKKDEKGYYYTRGRTGTDNPWSRDPRYLRTYVDIDKGKLVHDVWDDITTYRAQGDEYTGYPTQKPEELISRVLALSSNPGDLVLDCFVGSGTTAAVAQKLGRRWITADVNKGAVQTTSKRLQAIIRQQIEAGAVPQQMSFQTSEVSEDLGGLGGLGGLAPAALSFSVYRVNDYDLQIQHNEAVNLAVEMIGIEALKTDPFFDGTLGRRLVKIIPFNHPLTLLDLQLIQDELQARPDEERDITLVCLGKETTVDAWLEDYNKHRPVNKIQVIELRTDQKYGKFFVHQPAQAQVSITRVKTSKTSEVSEDLGGLLVVEIEDFISPTIVERLEMDTPLFKAQIPDWRAMVDIVLIDTAYDGQTFNIALSDVPARKNDLVEGRYELPAPAGQTTVAVKIIDMLGEEVLVTAEV